MQTDHELLLGVFDPECPLPEQASGRTQHWALKLANYEFKLQYKPGSRNGCADNLSCLPNPDTVAGLPRPAEAILLLSFQNATPATASLITRWTSKDPSLSLVHRFVTEGWPQDVPDGLQWYHWCRL